jgi:hypothetical protein
LHNDNDEKLWLNDAIYSRKKEIVQHNQFIFDTLWDNALLSEKRFRELETE